MQRTLCETNVKIMLPDADGLLFFHFVQNKLFVIDTNAPRKLSPTIRDTLFLSLRAQNLQKLFGSLDRFDSGRDQLLTTSTRLAAFRV